MKNVLDDDYTLDYDYRIEYGSEDASAEDHDDCTIFDIPDPIPFDLAGRVKELVDDGIISKQNILDLHTAITEREEDFADILGQVVEIIKSSEYDSSFEDLLRLYRENPLHLLFHE